MTLSIKLDLPHRDIFNSYVEALKEGHYIGIQPKATAEEIDQICADPDRFIADRQPDYTPEGVIETPDGTMFEKVPHEYLWLSVDGEFIGDVSLRLKLNALLENFGGHVGYGIRPGRQGQGWATKMLGLTKEWAKTHHGISPLLLSCSPDNPASESVIRNNGGVLIREGDIPYGYEGGRIRFFHV